MAVKKKQNTGSARIDPDVLAEAKHKAKSRGWLLSYYITYAVKKENSRKK